VNRMRVIAVDDHPIALRGIAAELAEHPDEFELVQTLTHPGLVDLAQPPVDVVVLDFRMEDVGLVTSLEWIEPFVTWGAKVLLNTSETRPVQLRTAIQFGASGLCLKSDDKLTEALRALRLDGIYVSGEAADALLHDPGLYPQLTQREVDTLQGIQDGLTHREVARDLGIVPDTVKAHLRSATSKYLALGREVTNSASVAREARRDGHLPPV